MSVKQHTSTMRFWSPTFQLRQEEVELKPGRITTLNIVNHPDAVTILPVDAQGKVIFIKQYRHPAKQTLLELPAGTLEGQEAPEAAAQRELQEEIGMKADKLEEIASFYLAPGYSTELMHVFLATGLKASRLPQDEDEVIELAPLPVSEALAKAVAGELKDAKSLAAVLLAAKRLGWAG
ncbi:MAG: NUDIX hydrolase [Anaerolineales bacterium]|nr:NUDIX hydrolase [Anaerolineales bacterium]